MSKCAGDYYNILINLYIFTITEQLLYSYDNYVSEETYYWSLECWFPSII